MLQAQVLQGTSQHVVFGYKSQVIVQLQHIKDSSVNPYRDCGGSFLNTSHRKRASR